MSATATEQILTDSAFLMGSSMIVILGYVLGIGIGYLVFKFGWSSIKTSLNGGLPSGGIFTDGQWTEPFENGQRYYNKRVYSKKYQDNIDVYYDTNGKKVNPWI